MNERRTVDSATTKSVPVLFVIGGLPGSGKSELSKHLAKLLGAVYLRIDSIEQAIKNSGGVVSGPEGYEVANRVALDNLRNGISVVADSVNPIQITRQAWQQVAQEAGAKIVQIEVRCSDPAEHRRRVETRKAEIPGHRLPTWDEVVSREFEAWDERSVRIDTAGKTAAESRKELEGWLRSQLLV